MNWAHETNLKNCHLIAKFYKKIPIILFVKTEILMSQNITFVDNQILMAEQISPSKAIQCLECKVTTQYPFTKCEKHIYCRVCARRLRWKCPCITNTEEEKKQQEKSHIKIEHVQENISLGGSQLVEKKLQNPEQISKVGWEQTQNYQEMKQQLEKKNQQLLQKTLKLTLLQSQIQNMKQVQRKYQILQQNYRILEDKLVRLESQHAQTSRQKQKINQQMTLFKNNVQTNQKLWESQKQYCKNIKTIINDYYKMLVNHFEEINNNFSYGLALQKIKMVKFLITNFETVMTVKSQQIHKIILDNKPLIRNYIGNDLKQFSEQISKMEITFELFNTNRIKIILHKLKLYKEIMHEQKALSNFQDAIADKINHFLSIVVQKNLINNKTAKNQFRLIEYLNKYLIFQASFEEELKVVYEKCGANLNLIRNNLFQSFKKIQSMFNNFNQEKSSIEKKIYENQQSINNLLKLIINIKIIVKNQKYLLEFERQTKRKINHYADQINKKLDEMRKSINKQIQNSRVTNNYDCNYAYLKTLTKMKDFDQIWENQQNFYYNFRFTQLYEKVHMRNQILRKVRINQIHLMIGQEKILIQKLQLEIDAIIDNEQMLHVLVCRIKEILTTKSFKLIKLNELSLLNHQTLEKFKQFCLQVRQFEQKIIKNKKELGNKFQIKQYQNIISSKIIVINGHLEQRYKYLFQNYNTSQFDQIQKEIKYLISFQQFLKNNFSKEYKQLRKNKKSIFIPITKQCLIFQGLQKIIQQGKAFIQYLANSQQQIKSEDYEKIKKFRKSFSSIQEQIIDKKIQQSIKTKIMLLQRNYWSKGIFDSSFDEKVKQNIDTLPSNLRTSLRDKLEKLKEQIMNQTKQKQTQVKNRLQQQGNSYIKKTLIYQIQQQKQKKTIYGGRFQKILQNYLVNLLSNQFKPISKRKQFVEQYIFKVKDKINYQDLKDLYAFIQFQAYKVFSTIPNLITNITDSFKQQSFISNKNFQNIQQLDQLASLHLFYQKEVSRSLLTSKTKLYIDSFFGKQSELIRNSLFNINYQIKFEEMHKQHKWENLIWQIIKIKCLYNISVKILHHKPGISPDAREQFRFLQEQVLKVEPKIKELNDRIKQAIKEINYFSFVQYMARELSDIQILTDLQKKEETLKNLIKIQQFLKKQALLCKSSIVSLVIQEIKHEQFIKNLQISWRQFYEASIKQEVDVMFKVDKKVSQKFQMFLKIKNIVKQKGIKFFSFIAKQEFDIKRYLIQQSKRIFLQTQKNIRQCGNQYGRYVLEIKSKLQNVQKKRKENIKQIQQRYQKKIQAAQEKCSIDSNQIGEEEMMKRIQTKQTQISKIQKLCNDQIQEISNKFQQTIDSLQDLWNGKKFQLFTRITNNIRVIKKLSFDFAQQGIKQAMQGYIQEIFKQVDKMHEVLKNDFTEHFYEKKSTCHIIANIVQQIPLFKDYQTLAFNQSVKHQDIYYVIKNCKEISCKTQQQKKKILSDFQIYKKQLQSIQKLYKQKKSQGNLNQIIDKTISEAMSTTAPILLGRIFGIQSILRIKHKQVLKFIRNPHPSQIVTILLLTQAKNDKGISQLSNGMAQVKTGEGKSIVLAGLCCYLALKGYQAYCACYSSYLSERDKKEFLSLFEKLRILDRVVYGTFADHCKGLLDSEKERIYFKDVIKQCLLNNNQSINIKYLPYLKRLQRIFEGRDQVKRVLIIDQVDVFFEERYFGQFFRPAISLNNQNIKELIEFIWKHKNLGNTFKQKQKLKAMIKNESCYRNLVSEWGHLQSFFQNQLQGMICAAADPTHSPRQIFNKQIVYRYSGIIEQSLNNGYKTVFSACQLREKNIVSQQFYDKSLKLSIITTQLSYAELPKYFTNILGVSGTLETLSKSRKDIMREKYNIENFFILPSIYGVSRRTIYNPIVFNSNYEMQLIEKIKECTQTGRPVLVFFANKNDMIELCQSQEVKTNIPDCYYLSEDEEEQMRDSIIRLAGKKGRVTFMTSYFSRGTDFLLQNKQLIDAGGFHVIQTYISKDESDYVQVCGRTARQGKKGTFQIIVNRDLLSSWKINCFDTAKLMDEIRNEWNSKDQRQGQRLKEKIMQAKQIHQNSYKVIKSLAFGTIPLIKEIQKLNKVRQASSKNIKSIIAIDGTGSMNSVLSKVKEVLQIAIGQTQIIIQQKKINASFEQQIMIYRNYSSKSIIFERSGFMNDSKNLTSWIGNIQASGGQGNEAIQIIYNKINDMEDVNQLIIIGDARCNTHEEMILKRNIINSDPQYWKNINVPFIQSPEEQFKKLVQKKIPIHSLYITNSQTVKNYFTSVSKQTNGVCKQFRVHDENAGKVLASFIAENVLNQIGGEELVSQFRMRFG